MNLTRHRSKLYLLAILMTSFLVSTIGYTAEVDGTLYDDEHHLRDIRMELKGAATLRYLRFIKAYTGAFYLQEGIHGNDALQDVPKRLVLEYRYAISAEDFAKATTEIIRKNVNESTFQRIESKIRELNNMYRSVKPSDRYSLNYSPEQGTELALNGVSLGVIPGADFAYAVFSIWIGNAPIDESFRDRLLGI